MVPKHTANYVLPYVDIERERRKPYKGHRVYFVKVIYSPDLFVKELCEPTMSEFHSTVMEKKKPPLHILIICEANLTSVHGKWYTSLN